jgi:LysR family glycine cleavage system transcriptional activator
LATLPPLRALQAFEAVGRRGSVTDAALELGVSPGAISQQIRKVEEVLGLRLLERRGRSVELTSWGRLYHAGIQQGFEQLRSAQEALGRARTRSSLVVSCLPSVASRWMGPQLFDWHAAHAGAGIRLVGTDSEPRLGEDQIDFRISYGGKVRAFDHYAELFTDWVVPACAPSLVSIHALRQPADILRLPLLSIEWVSDHRSPPDWTDWARSIGAAYQEAGGELTFALSSAAIDAAVNGRGVVLAQVAMIADDLASGRLVIPFDHRLKLPDAYFLAWDRAALDKPFGAEFRAWVLAIAKKQAFLSAGIG